MEYQAFRFKVEDGLIPETGIPCSSQLHECTFISHSSPISYEAPDVTEIVDAGNKILDWIKAVGFPSTSSDKHENISLTAASTIACMVPGLDLKDDKTLAGIYFVFWMYTMDDIFDPLMEDNKPGMANTIRAGFKILIDILSGIPRSVVDIKACKIPHFGSSCRLLKDAVQNLETHIPNFHQNKEFLVKGIGNFLNAFLWRYDRDQNGSNCSESTYIYFRTHFSGFYPLFELIALINDVKLTVAERENIEFIRYMNATAAATSVTNDILSLRKEINDCQTENFVMHKTINKKLRIGEALIECIEYVNQETNEAAIYSNRLLKNPGRGDEMKKYIDLVNYSVEGHMRFCAFSKRYGSIQIIPVVFTLDTYKNFVYNYKSTCASPV